MRWIKSCVKRVIGELIDLLLELVDSFLSDSD